MNIQAFTVSKQAHHSILAISKYAFYVLKIDKDKLYEFYSSHNRFAFGKVPPVVVWLICILGSFFEVGDLTEPLTR